MIRVILLQAVATAVAVVMALVLFGWRGGASAALGGLACLLPNLLFALRLKRVARRPVFSFQANFLLGELVKIVAIVGLLVLFAKGYADLHWPSLLMGLVLATQAVFFAFWKKN